MRLPGNAVRTAPDGAGAGIQEPECIVADVLAATGTIHVVIGNDGYPAIVCPVEEASAADLHATLDALVVMPFRLVGAVVPISGGSAAVPLS